MDGVLSRDVLTTPGIDRALGALADRHRRLLLSRLRAGRVEEADVTMRGSEPEEVDADLRRVHLPLLEEQGIIEWDREAGEIRKGPNFDEVEPLLRLMEEHPEELPPSWR